MQPRNGLATIRETSPPAPAGRVTDKRPKPAQPVVAPTSGGGASSTLKGKGKAPAASVNRGAPTLGPSSQAAPAASLPSQHSPTVQGGAAQAPQPPAQPPTRSSHLVTPIDVSNVKIIPVPSQSK